MYKKLSDSPLFNKGDTEIWYAKNPIWFTWDMGITKIDLPKTKEDLSKSHVKIGNIDLTDLNSIFEKKYST